jgi:hypothetical protein
MQKRVCVHPYPGCLRMSGKQRGYATESAQERQTQDLGERIFALLTHDRELTAVCGRRLKVARQC